MNNKWCLIIRGIEATEEELRMAEHRIRDVFGLIASGTITVADYVYEQQTKLKLSQPGKSRVGSRTNLPS